MGITRGAVIAYCGERFGDAPDCPFADTPDAQVLRHRENRRWYALLLRVSRRQLFGTGEGDADILNVKLDPLLINSLCTQPGYRRAYHMNHTQWLTVVLDDVSDAAAVCPLIDMSHALTAPKRRKPRPSAAAEM